MINVEPDIIITNCVGEKFSVKANQGWFDIDINYYGTRFHGGNCIVSRISPGRCDGNDSIILEIVPRNTNISKGDDKAEEKLSNNIELDDNCA